MSALSNTQKVQHLYWRAGFGMSPQEWKDKRNLPLSTVINDLLNDQQKNQKVAQLPDNIPADKQTLRAMSSDDRKAFNKQGNLDKTELRKTWQDRMGSDNYNPLAEKLTLFWHSHFASRSKFYHYTLMQLNTLREHALGNFKAMTHAISKDPTMLNFLNNQQNKKRQPNENFARELCELFTIGIGHYTENDIKEAARAFTGWRTTVGGQFQLVKAWHDYDQKTFMGQSGKFNGEDIIEIIFENPQTARHITTKIYKYFVNYEVNTAHIDYLSNLFYHSDYDIKTLMRGIFESDWFYDSKIVANRIKSPIELLAGMTRQSNLQFKFARQVAYLQKALGQLLFNPPNVAGWPDGKTWIDNQTLLLRLNIPMAIAAKTEIEYKERPSLKDPEETRIVKRMINGKMVLDEVFTLFSKTPENDLYDALCEYLLAVPPSIPKSKIEYGLNPANRQSYIRTMIVRIQSMPEYQVC